MKKLAILSVTCLLIVFSCTKKVAPVISSRTEFPEAPKTTKPAATATSPEMIVAGKTLYNGKCARCHDAKDPTEYTAPRWESILKSMIPKAKLNEQQAGEVRAYVMENAKK